MAPLQMILIMLSSILRKKVPQFVKASLVYPGQFPEENTFQFVFTFNTEEPVE